MAKRGKKTSAPSGPPPTLADYVAAFCNAPLTRKAVMDLSSMLAKVVGFQIQEFIPKFPVEVGHRHFGGSIRRHHLDAFISNQHLGLQMGIDVKGLNSPSSVQKNWNNRVGDLHELSSNHHQIFPKAVMGGVLAIPSDGLGDVLLDRIESAMTKLGGRRAVSNAFTTLEVASLIVINKAEGRILPDRPRPGSPLRVEFFAKTMAEIFNARWLE